MIQEVVFGNYTNLAIMSTNVMELTNKNYLIIDFEVSYKKNSTIAPNFQNKNI